MSGAGHRRKGDRIEREIVERLKAVGVHAERYPLSGASRFRGKDHDVDVYLFGIEDGPLVTEVKARKEGSGSKLITKWLGENDQLITRDNNADPIVHIPWRVYERIAMELNRGKKPVSRVRLVSSSD